MPAQGRLGLVGFPTVATEEWLVLRVTQHVGLQVINKKNQATFTN